MNENLPGFVRCVHPKREGAEWFNAATANNVVWQNSTGWKPQPLPEKFEDKTPEIPKKEDEFPEPIKFLSDAQLSEIKEQKPKGKGGRPKKSTVTV